MTLRNFLFSWRKGMFWFYLGVLLSWQVAFQACDHMNNLYLWPVAVIAISYVFMTGWYRIYCDSYNKKEYWNWKE